MKKFLIILALICFSISPAVAKKLKVEALDDFSTINPSTNFRIRVLQNASEDDLMPLRINTVLEGKVIKIHARKRCKRDSAFEFVPMSITYNGVVDEIKNPYVSIHVSGVHPTNSPKKVVFTTARTAAGFFLWGLPQGVSFAQGALQAPDGMKIESGLKKVYHDSFLSYIESGVELEIHKGDVLYMKMKKF